MSRCTCAACRAAHSRATAIARTKAATRSTAGLEGDAGGFQITPAKNGAILIEVSSDGMTFENDSGFATLERDAGDDRSFLLRPAACS